MTRAGTAKGRQPNGASSIYLGKDGRWHGRVTVGVKDDGTPDRRHVSRKTRAEVTKTVRELERQRDKGAVRKAGQSWTIETWLAHWVENIAAPNVSENTIDGYRVAVHHHLVPGLGAHRLEKLEPEHLERFYKKMQESGSAAGTAHQVHRTLRTALNEAVRRGHAIRNPATIAKAPRLEEEEVEPYSVEEIQRLLAEAGKHRNAARWVIALALGLRQGEVLGMQWADVDFELGVIRVRRGRLRPRYEHGCGNRCGRKPGFCPQKINVRRETKSVKSRAGQRPIGVPEELMDLLRRHKEEQVRERALARDLWTEKGYVFTSPVGEPLNPNTDFHRWKDLLKAAGVRDGRLHDARHTAATVLLILGISDAVVDAIMGWEPGKSARMRRRYQHLTGPVLQQTAAKIGGLLWGTPTVASSDGIRVSDLSQRTAPAELTVYVARLDASLVPFLRREHADALVKQWSTEGPDRTAAVEEWSGGRWEREGSGSVRDIRDRMADRRVIFHAQAVFLPGGERLNTDRSEKWSVSAWEFETDSYTDMSVRWHVTRRPGREVEALVRGTDRGAVEAAFAEACAQALNRAKDPGGCGEIL
ncbi:site-specific integrase [Streptomyces sp. P01-B04]|uniref:tyrosine-type recombinase/integrase n=1 Tax=Streptomyces poriferorum TaxID=2798799 RepID=UPI001C5EEA70|nr:tyrosine-type recombinase/integrase [Streptomyces poriferorum]MBW5250110.1 site-specific integrase [Streptomyces poriferorum]MBW5258937.1 site-specific integrase [Streptomyces poriferorum]